ncbi:glycine-rich protein DOT1-like [Tribolium madens]|uniref:glycine-rich protein DOT1-like n=1 Tax=Tribolium madens TaxID=41895 RepID=UPI001CF75672|nr:glycine-rich protein DOT1-like [Tribolium madens]
MTLFIATIIMIYVAQDYNQWIPYSGGGTGGGAGGGVGGGIGFGFNAGAGAGYEIGGRGGERA